MAGFRFGQVLHGLALLSTARLAVCSEDGAEDDEGPAGDLSRVEGLAEEESSDGSIPDLGGNTHTHMTVGIRAWARGGSDCV